MRKTLKGDKMSAKAGLEADLDALDRLAFGRREYSEPEIRRYYELVEKEGAEWVEKEIGVLRRWLLTPFTLWPMNIHDITIACLTMLEKGHGVGEEMMMFLQLLPEPPEQKVCAAVATAEHVVATGTYEDYVKIPEKFYGPEEDILKDPELQEEWAEIKKQWDTSRFANNKGVIRRTLVNERSLRNDFSVNWKKSEERFQAVFDIFCQKWNLYGMEGDKPLLAKLSVNLTPHGTMIFIPSYWSVDFSRDIQWRGVTKLHRIRVPHKQGKKLIENNKERQKEAAKLRKLDLEVKKRRLRGREKHLFLCKGLGLSPETDAKRFQRLREEKGYSGER